MHLLTKWSHIINRWRKDRLVNMSIYIIAEIGINHNGDIKIAKKLIENASELGLMQ